MAATTNQIMFVWCIFLIFATLCSADKSANEEDEIKVEPIDIKPGGMEHTHETEWVNNLSFVDPLSSTWTVTYFSLGHRCRWYVSTQSQL